MLFMTWWPAVLWQARQALVTSGPKVKVCCSSLNLLWSAVEDRSSCGAAFGLSGVVLARAGVIIAERQLPPARA